MVLLGHVLYLQLRWHKLRSDVRDAPPHQDVLQWYEKALVTKDAHSELLQYMRMGRIYLWLGKAYEAKDVLIKACRLQPSASSWLGLAIACHLNKVHLCYPAAPLTLAVCPWALRDLHVTDLDAMPCEMRNAMPVPGGCRACYSLTRAAH